MSRPTTIFCAVCGEPCGREYPDRFSNLDGGEPGFREGRGEDFNFNGEWYCSQKCYDQLALTDLPSIDAEIERAMALRKIVGNEPITVGRDGLCHGKPIEVDDRLTELWRKRAETAERENND